MPLQIQAFDPAGTALGPGARTPLGGFLVATIDSDYVYAVVGEITSVRRRVPWASLGLVIPELTGPHFKAAAALADLTAARFVHFRARPFREVRASLRCDDARGSRRVSDALTAWSERCAGGNQALKYGVAHAYRKGPQ